MKVHIYIDNNDVVLLSGLFVSNTVIDTGGIEIKYSNEPLDGMIMVSMSIDEFVYLQDQDVLIIKEFLLN
jgi:hypothetical protein